MGMAYLRRLPGVVYLYRYQTLTLVLLGALLLYVANQSGIVCSNHDVQSVVEQLCTRYGAGLALGALCEPMCGDPSMLESITCTGQHAGKALVFSAKWANQMVYIKSAHSASKRGKTLEVLPALLSENAFKDVVRHLVARKLNITVTDQQLDRLMHITARPMVLDGDKRQLEQQEVLTLLTSQEYMLSVLFADREVFPQVYGTCGHLYAVEELHSPDVDAFYIFNGQHVWSERMKLAILIMDLLEQLETAFPDPLRLCDIKMNHFGLTSIGGLKYLDSEMVHTDNVLQRLTGGGQVCKGDADCDLMDCKASCNPRTLRCDQGVSNNNLQVVCEKIFVGWTLSGKLMVPGLLMTENTPASLASLLRQCADNGRGAVPEDIRQSLYTTLTEMDQILSERLAP